MARGKKPKEFVPKLTGVTQKFSFDTETVIYLAAAQYRMRAAIEEKMVEIAPSPHCIPVSVCKKAMKEMGLSQFGDG